MLKVLAEGEAFQSPCALLLGGFDGFHTGHGTLLSEAKKTGLPVGLTTISGGKTGGDLFTFQERETVFDREGFSFAIELPFSDALKNTPAEAFLGALFARLNVRAIFCGEDFRFGKDAGGTPELLKRAAPCPVTVLPLKTENGEKIAVSAIKKRLAEGNVAAANKELRGGFFVQGIVEHGRQVGRSYGFPTLNVSYPARKFPLRDGVYAGFAETPAGNYPAIVNLGARPTFALDEKKVEAYLKGFDGDLYGAEVRIYFTEFLRPVMKFSGKEALQAQLLKDIECV